MAAHPTPSTLSQHRQSPDNVTQIHLQSGRGIAVGPYYGHTSFPSIGGLIIIYPNLSDALEYILAVLSLSGDIEHGA